MRALAGMGETVSVAAQNFRYNSGNGMPPTALAARSAAPSAAEFATRIDSIGASNTSARICRNAGLFDAPPVTRMRLKFACCHRECRRIDSACDSSTARMRSAGVASLGLKLYFTPGVSTSGVFSGSK